MVTVLGTQAFRVSSEKCKVQSCVAMNQEQQEQKELAEVAMDTTESHNTASALPTPTKDSVHPEAGLKTSDFYKTKNIPERFNHPDWFEGYNSKPDHPFYRTSSSIHGSKPPSVHTMPIQFHGRKQKFTASLGKFGMYRNQSLNTARNDEQF